MSWLVSTWWQHCPPVKTNINEIFTNITNFLLDKSQLMRSQKKNHHLQLVFENWWVAPSKSTISLNLFQPSVAFHIETSHLICNANQMSGFYMKSFTALKWVDFFFAKECAQNHLIYRGVFRTPSNIYDGAFIENK